MKQMKFKLQKPSTSFGGSLLKPGRRKTARPLAFKKPLHLVLKATDAVTLFHHRAVISTQIKKLSARFGIRVYSSAIQADHIHLNLRLFNRDLYRKWIRALTGTLARRIPRLKWRLRPFTRIMSWGREFSKVKTYLQKNQWEANLFKLAEELERGPLPSLRSITGPLGSCAGLSKTFAGP